MTKQINNINQRIIKYGPMHYLSLSPNSPPPLLSRHTNHKLTNITPLTLSTSKHNLPIDSRIACLYYKTTQTH